MSSLFPYANVVAGVLVLVVGFCFHWLGQFVSVLNWELATRLGLQEKALLPEYRVYEHAIAVADTAMGWLYGIAAVGLFLNAEWGYKLAWIPAVILVYHGLSFWFWVGNQNKAGYQLISKRMRIGWSLSNLVIGLLAILVAWG